MPWWSAIVGPFRPWSAWSKENQISICLFQMVVLPLVEYEDGALTVKGFGDSSYREVGESLQES